ASRTAWLFVSINSQRGDRRIQATGESPVLPWQEKTKKKTGVSPDEAGQMTGRYRHAAGPVTRILSSGLRGRLRSRRIVGLGAASSGPDWRSIRDVLSVARFASALVPKHQSPLVNTCVRLALLQAPSFSYGVVDTFLASGLQYFQPARLLPLNSGFQPSLLEYCSARGCGGAAGAAAVPARNASMTTEQIPGFLDVHCIRRYSRKGRSKPSGARTITHYPENNTRVRSRHQSRQFSGPMR